MFQFNGTDRCIRSDCVQQFNSRSFTYVSCLKVSNKFHSWVSFMFQSNRQGDDGPLGLYRLSYLWYSAVGCFTVVIVGMIVSALTGFQNPRKLDPDLICNTGETMFFFLPRGVKEFLRFNVGDDFVSHFSMIHFANFIFFPGWHFFFFYFSFLDSRRKGHEENIRQPSDFFVTLSSTDAKFDLYLILQRNPT